MGCGKTTSGKTLSKKLAIPFYDLDDLIEDQIGMTIAGYFAKHGEEKFRMIEKECLQKTFSFNTAIIATGGGTPCFFDNLEMINTNGISFYIKADVKLLISRIVDTKDTRPLISNLKDNEMVENLNNLLTKRKPFYEKANHIVSAIDTVDEILGIVNKIS